MLIFWNARYVTFSTIYHLLSDLPGNVTDSLTLGERQTLRYVSILRLYALPNYM